MTMPPLPLPDTAPGPAPYLTVQDVAAMLQVSTKTVNRWARADATMPVLRIGGAVRFHRERLERWLRDREQGAPRPRICRRVPSARQAVETKDGR
jgi:excisionase family DNA binding protein